jgi:hypothetical protein
MENVFDAQVRHNALNIVGRLRGGDRAAMPQRSRRLHLAAHFADGARELLPLLVPLPRAA